MTSGPTGDRLLLIGQAPSRTGDPSETLLGRIGLRLADLMGLSLDEYAARTERMNLFDCWPGKDGKGDRWDRAAARERTKELRHLLEGRRVLFVGRNVADAFGFAGLPFLEWSSNDELQVDAACIPHPSGIVMWWNEPDNRAAAREFLHDVFESGTGGDR